MVAIVAAGAVAGGSAYGAFSRVSFADLHAGLVAIRKEREAPEAYAFRVVSANEIWVYFTPSRGKWCAGGGQTLLSTLGPSAVFLFCNGGALIRRLCVDSKV